MKNLLYFILIIAIFGQPNALSVIIPIYPSIAFAVNILLVFSFVLKKTKNKEIIVFRMNLLLPILCFTLYSFLSLSFAPDPPFGFRILLSVIFKFILFIQITSICYKLELIEAFLKIVSRMGALFAVQSILLTIATAIFKIQPVANVNTFGGIGLLDYDYQMVSYGILGFGKQFVNIYGMEFPRFQSMFAEPGYFANFLELSIFSTIGYSHTQTNRPNTSLNLSLIVQFIALFGSFSTGGWISTFFGYLIYLMCKGTKNQTRSLNKFIIICMCLLICFIVFTSSFPTVADEIYKIVWAEKFETDWGSSSAGQRTDVVELAQNLFLQRPIIGWGSNQMRIVADGVGANNALVTIAVELGAIGIAIYSSMIIAIARTISINYKIAIVQSNSIINLNASSSGCAAALIVHSFFVDSNWSFLYWIGLSYLYSVSIFLRVNNNLTDKRSILQ
jgi:O-Antigen ligase